MHPNIPSQPKISTLIFHIDHIYLMKGKLAELGVRVAQCQLLKLKSRIMSKQVKGLIVKGRMLKRHRIFQKAWRGLTANSTISKKHTKYSNAKQQNTRTEDRLRLIHNKQ
ncbi:Hypothetical_protein [Hexamita inflata]|uniref:Hypothetical_protein n=1 Tax=Hexamita inflata TaxID=28002 RepID=A0AA86RGC2_9EUKA|nr:Hypothetical protein HINF_LOCUS63627 [Hexamita inflata]